MKIPYIKLYTADLLAAGRNVPGDAILDACALAFENHTVYRPKTTRKKRFLRCRCSGKTNPKVRGNKTKN